MIIDTDAAVLPPRLLDKAFTRSVGTYLAHADQDDLLASHLCMVEARVVLDIYSALDRQKKDLESRAAAARERLRSLVKPDDTTPTDQECRQLAIRTGDALRRESDKVRGLHRRVAEIYLALQKDSPDSATP
ncbi:MULTISPECIES: hypothetical protein [Streptacidiphilus]|uniref:Restriction endonuclease n=1 Tax=Streptacidiphilus cavernicola TaxID=3342716 RepID=A0ABV6UWE5_9ACTN|nr:hypothetical protein [Streptacidiphilus jeojiense]